MPAAQLALPIPNPHGGRRRGAGRPNLSGRQGHVARPRLTGRHPVHVTMRVREGIPSLRRRDMFRCLRAAVRTARGRGLGVVQFAILGNHIHLILEPGREGCGMAIQSLCVSFARRVNARLGRSGPVFGDRYHLHVLATPSEARRALDYVLTNDSRHRRDRVRTLTIDPYSSALAFRRWKALLSGPHRFEFSSWSEDAIAAWHGEILVPARTWLMREGWRRGSPSRSFS